MCLFVPAAKHPEDYFIFPLSEHDLELNDVSSQLSINFPFFRPFLLFVTTAHFNFLMVNNKRAERGGGRRRMHLGAILFLSSLGESLEKKRRFLYFSPLKNLCIALE